jgi:hypothetical protein
VAAIVKKLSAGLRGEGSGGEVEGDEAADENIPVWTGGEGKL